MPTRMIVLPSKRRVATALKDTEHYSLQFDVEISVLVDVRPPSADVLKSDAALWAYLKESVLERVSLSVEEDKLSDAFEVTLLNVHRESSTRGESQNAKA